ncbi:BTAD domain-containing putative transcriptional regulator [Streptomyces sp. E5N91]|uniref:AfsR/SARP family transcriptional regulator n=1 Tax=Streptomyces sp. E5N91 TaxID=1851996 RepID=UPI000EF60B21|nr:BTAD domain-containing putative transcriptional regulator [Streptomyces sp. E5N91]
MRYSILGTVRVTCDGTALELGPPKRMALLALLLLRAPGPLPLSEAVDILWDDDPPPSAVNVVHRHIGALRRTLEPELRSRTKAQRLVRAADGYRLLVDTTSSDLLHFRNLRSQGQVAVKAGNPEKGAQDLIEALGLWLGPTVAAGTYVAQHPLFTSVGHEYVATAKEAADVVLTAAPALTEALLPSLRRAVACHPFDEALHSRIIAALAATGRRAEALQQFETIRHTLAEELGVEPSPGLLAAQEHLLRHRPARKEGEETVAAPAPSVRPARLPAAHHPFAGRREVLSQCLASLPPEGEEFSRSTTVAVCGMAGVGKTALATHWAHLVATRFPDGQIHVDLQGHHTSHPPLDPPAAMAEVLGALGARPGVLPENPAELAALYRAELAGRRLLLVLDDADDCEQVRPLLPAAPGCLTIVTSRRRLEGLTVTDNARLLLLPPMTGQEGMELLEQRLGADRVRDERKAAEEIVDLCGGLPLAMAVVCARALLHPMFPLTALVNHLHDAKDSLVGFSGHDARTDVRSVFSRSYETLSAGAAALFRLLVLHPAPDITLSDATRLSGAHPQATREHMAELVDRSMLWEQTPGRYTCHVLLRSYAAEMVRGADGKEAIAEARARVGEQHLRSADTSTTLLDPQDGDTVLPSRCPGRLS